LALNYTSYWLVHYANSGKGKLYYMHAIMQHFYSYENYVNSGHLEKFSCTIFNLLTGKKWPSGPGLATLVSGVSLLRLGSGLAGIGQHDGCTTFWPSA
jgi:hypothetical protein